MKRYTESGQPSDKLDRQWKSARLVSTLRLGLSWSPIGAIARKCGNNYVVIYSSKIS